MADAKIKKLINLYGLSEKKIHTGNPSGTFLRTARVTVVTAPSVCQTPRTANLKKINKSFTYLAVTYLTPLSQVIWKKKCQANALFEKNERVGVGSG